MTVLDVEILGGGKPVFGDVQAWRAIPENRQTIGVFIGQGMEQERVGYTED